VGYRQQHLTPDFFIEMKRIFAIDNASESCSVALYDGSISCSLSRIASRGHGDAILQMLRQLLDETGYTKNSIDVLAFGRGPGAFTSLRVGAGIIQGLAVGMDRPVVAISSLAALAHGVFRTRHHKRTVVAIDARMGQVYHAAYETRALGDSVLLNDEQVSDPSQIVWPTGDWSAVGNGWQVYENDIEHGEDLQYLGVGVENSALDVAYLSLKEDSEGKAVSAELAIPVYIRDKVAHKKS